jgi:SH3 domain protein
MKHAALCLLLMMFLVQAGPAPASASDNQLYVAGDLAVSLRSSPNVRSKLLAELRSGAKLDLLKEEGDWTQVRTAEGKTGWIMKRYVTATLPAAQQFEEYKAKSQELIAKADRMEAVLAAHEQEKKGLADALAAARRERDEVTKDYEALKADAGDVVGLEARYRQLAVELKNTNDILAQVQAENGELASQRTIKWFLAGGSVILAGLFIGFVIGRTGRKQRTSRLYM